MSCFGDWDRPGRLLLFTLPAAMDADMMCYQFSRANVERGDFSHFLSCYAPDRLPLGRHLHQMMGTFLFAIDGYNDDPRELDTIPEVRQFYSAFHKAWPYWLYFCDLNQDGLKLMVFCCLHNHTSVKVDGQPNSLTEFSPLELVRFIASDFPYMNELCDRAQMSERLIYDRSKAVFEYLGLPFDTPVPAAP